MMVIVQCSLHFPTFPIPNLFIKSIFFCSSTFCWDLHHILSLKFYLLNYDNSIFFYYVELYIQIRHSFHWWNFSFFMCVFIILIVHVIFSKKLQQNFTIWSVSSFLTFAEWIIMAVQAPHLNIRVKRDTSWPDSVVNVFNFLHIDKKLNKLQLIKQKLCVLGVNARCSRWETPL